MAIYTTFFLCKPAELPSGFPDWRLPLAEPVRREVRDPDTGEVRIVESCVPEWPEEAFEDFEETAQDYRVVVIEGSYEEYLEERLPPFVRSCPHWATKGLMDLELGPLLEAVGVPASLEHSIYCPPPLAATVQQLPAEFIGKLPALDQQKAAEMWAVAMSTPYYTHSVSGNRVRDDWTVGEALEYLQPLAGLARKAGAGQHMYLLTEA
jgi:hypothetical protein